MDSVRHIFIIGSKSIGQYGGYETFVDKLTEQHRDDPAIRYHIACKANGNGYMDETRLEGVTVTRTGADGSAAEFTYNNAHVVKLHCPNIGSAVAIYYDRAALKYFVDYCKKNEIRSPIFYILACRAGLYIKRFARQIKALNGRLFINPDGHEWMRSKWSAPVRRYWKWSEGKMVNAADMIVCDSVNIEKYIHETYGLNNTTFIAYGADTGRSVMGDDDPKLVSWFGSKGLAVDDYYLIVGRFVPENNYETMIREFMNSKTTRKLAIITNDNDKFCRQLMNRLHFDQDDRIRFVGTVYDKELLKKIRECAHAYLHGHEVGGTNPSLLEAMGSTSLNLLLDVGFNREVAGGSALYWNKDEGSLSGLIDDVDNMSEEMIREYGNKAKKRITDFYSWRSIGEKYREIFA